MRKVLRWIPAILMMAAIFTASSIPSVQMPQYGSWDTLVKKGGHVAGYAGLTLSFYYALGANKRRGWLAFLFSGLYAILDEFHQSFVPGRNPSWVDALLIDNLGALLALESAAWFERRQRKRDTEPSSR